MLENLVYLGALVASVGSVFYIREIIAGRVSPNLVTWLLWGLAPMLAFAGQISEGVGLVALTTFVVAANPLVVVLCALIFGRSRWEPTRFDWVCGGLSVVGLAAWMMTSEPLMAIMMAIVADALAGAPTLYKAWRRPESESPSAFYTTAFNALTGVIAAGSFTFATVGFSLYLMIFASMTGTVVVLRGRRRFMMRSAVVEGSVAAEVVVQRV